MGEEDEVLEFKTSTAELPAALDSIVAILNKHQKGTLYFDIRNNGRPIGQQMSENTLRDVTRSITDHIEPRIYPIVEKVIIEGKECIRVQFEGDDIPYFSNGRAYIRVGEEDKKISPKELKRIIMKVEEKNNRWEEKPSSITDEATPEDYINKFEPSRPRNPLIAQTMYLSGEIERWGTGIKNIYNICKQENLKVEFEDRKTAFFVTIYRKNLKELVENTEKDLTKNVTTNVTTKINKTENKILNIIRNNSKITQREIAEITGLTERTIKRNTDNLKEKGIIKRVGATKNGYWEIIK